MCRRAERERQDGHAEAERDPGGVDRCLARAACGQHQDHHDRQDGPDLDRPGEAQEYAAQEEPPGTARDLVAVE